MFKPLEIFVGIRYTRAKKRSQFISFISAVSIICISISVTSLVTVMSVMNGFDYQLKKRILGAVSDITIVGVSESPHDWPHALYIAKTSPHVRGAAPYVAIQSLLQGSAATGAMVRGIDPSLEPNVVNIGQHMLHGSLDALTPGSWNVALGQDLATTLGVRIGDQIVIAAASLHTSRLNNIPHMRGFHVVGIFAVGTPQSDSTLALVNIEDAKKLGNLVYPSGIRLKLDNIFDARPIARELASKLGPPYQVQTWSQSNANLFSAMSMEKRVMGTILSLIVLVAVINLISMLMMLVTDKQADIAILRTLGTTPLSVMGIFMVQGLLVGLVGIGFGVSLGSLLSWKLPSIAKVIERVFHVQFLPPSMYYISEVPSRLELHDVVWVVLVTFTFSLLATLYPAWRASRTQPAQALRYE